MNLPRRSNDIYLIAQIIKCSASKWNEWMIESERERESTSSSLNLVNLWIMIGKNFTKWNESFGNNTAASYLTQCHHIASLAFRYTRNWSNLQCIWIFRLNSPSFAHFLDILLLFYTQILKWGESKFYWIIVKAFPVSSGLTICTMYLWKKFKNQKK